MADETKPKGSVVQPERGKSGTLIYSGIITNEEYNNKLRGVVGNHQYEIMRRSDSTVRALLQVIKLPILSTTWSVEPAVAKDGSISDVAKKQAEFVEYELFHHKVNWHEFIRQALTMLDFGHSVFEKVYEVYELEGVAHVGLKKLASRKQVTITRWSMSDGVNGGDGSPGITQWVGSDTISIPRDRLAIFTHNREGDNYEGISELRSIYKDWDMKDKLTLVNAMALEKQGIGIPVVTERDNMTSTPTERAEADDALANVRANNKAHLRIPNTMQVEMLDMKGQTTKEIIPTLNYHDARIMKAGLAGFLELGGASGSGSQSLSKDLTSLFMKSEEALANELLSTITEDVVKQLCDFNFTDLPDGYPKVSFGQLSDDDVDTMATALANLANAGLLSPDAEVEDHLRGIYRVPLMTKEQKEGYTPPEPKPVTPPAADPAKPELPVDPKKEDVKASLEGARKYRAELVGLLLGSNAEG